MGLSIGLGISNAKTGAASSASLFALTLSSSTIPENTAPGVVVGTISGKTLGSTIALIDNAGARFALSGNNIVTGLTMLDYETATSHSITVRETLMGVVNSPRDTVFTITVTDVVDGPNLSALTLSPSSIVEASASGTVVGSIGGKTTGSTLSLTDGAGGRFTLSGTSILAGTTATNWTTATSHNITVQETLAGSPNSPRSTTLAITVQQALGGTPDYTVTNDAQWTSTMALGGATLSGKTIRINGNLGATAIPTLSMGATLTIEGAPGASVQDVVWNGSCTKTIWKSIKFNGTGWAGGNVMRFTAGTHGDHEFLDCEFRHGYSASLIDTPTGTPASIPEIQKPTVSGTAGATSAVTALPAWNNDLIDGGWVTVKNNGTAIIYAALGTAAIVATTSSQAINPGAGYTFQGLNYPHPTHIATLAASGTCAFTADMQQGLSLFQRDGITQGGSVSWSSNGLSLIRCTFRDLNNAARLPLWRVIDCTFERIYQDCLAGGVDGTIIARNVAQVTWGASDHAQNPHGDFYQMSATSPTTSRKDVLIAGNVLLVGADPADSMQFTFLSDRNFNPSYEFIHFIGNVAVNTPGYGVYAGESDAGWPAKDLFVVGNTIIGSAANIDADGPIRMGCGTNYSFAWGNISGVQNNGAGAVQKNNVILSTFGGSRASVFPNFANVLSANSRATMLAAVNPAGAGAGLGVDLDLIDYTTTTYTQAALVKYANMPSGAAWALDPIYTVSTLVTLPLRIISNKRTGQVVTPGAGVEWRSVATDGTTQVQAWTASPGTIEPGQFIQIRFTTGASGSTGYSVTMTINGFADTMSYTTAAAAPSTFWTVGAGAPNTYLRDTANLAAGTTRLVGKLKLYIPTAPSASFAIFGQATSAWRLEMNASRNLFVTVKDSTNTNVVSNATVLTSGAVPVVVAVADWTDITFDVNHTAQTVTLTINGVTHPAIAFATAGSGSQRGSVPIAIGSATSGGSALWPSGTRVADVIIERNGTTYKTLAGASAATINADGWKPAGAASAT